MSLLVFLLLSTVFRVVFSLMLRNIVTNGTDETMRRCPGTWRASTAADIVSRTCLDDDTLSDQYRVRDLNLQLSWYFAPIYGVTFMMWGPGLVCLIMFIWALTVICSVQEKFDLLTAVFGKYSSSWSIPV